MHCDYNNCSITSFHRHSYQLASLLITLLIHLFVVLSSSFSSSFSSSSSSFSLQLLPPLVYPSSPHFSILTTMSDAELREGMVFDTMKEARITVKTWLLRKGWSSKVLISNAQRLGHICRVKDCPFSLNIRTSKKGIRLTKLIHHTYPISTHDKFHGRSSVAVMSKDPLNICLFVDEPKTRPAQIRRQELRVYGNRITMHMAW